MDDLAITEGGPAWLATWAPAAVWLARANTVATRRRYASAVRQFANMVTMPLGDVECVHVIAFKAAMVSRGLAPRTVRNTIIIIGALFTWCIEAGHHPGPNPTAGVPLPRVGREPAGLALAGEQVEALVGATETARDRALVRLLADGGLRASELCGLQERDVFLQKSAGSITAASVHVRRGKGGRARDVALGADAAGAMVAYLAAGPRVRGLTRSLFQWLDGSGQGIGYHTVYRVVRQAAAVAGLGHVAPHDLRRTQITMALDGGAPAPEVQRNAGHASMEQTVRYYRGSK